MSPLHPTDKLKPITATYPWPSVKSLLQTMAALALGYVLLLAYLHYTSEAEFRRLFGGSAGLAAIRSPDHVEAYRIDKLAGPKTWTSATAPSDFSVLAGPVAVSDSDIQKLHTALEDRNSYRHLYKACIPQPGVRLDFIHGDDRFSVLLCFECDAVMNYLNGSYVGGGDFDDMRPALVGVVRSIFPNDPKIQSLNVGIEQSAERRN